MQSQTAQLPPEALKFAKKMGIDLSGLEPEAQDIWKMLDEMSKNDPLQYQDFVRQQFENARVEEEVTDKSNKTTKVASQRSFRPSGEFLLIKCASHICQFHLYFQLGFVSSLERLVATD